MNQSQKVCLIKTGSWSESIQTALIAQINKLYKQIATLRQNNRKNEDFIEKLSNCKSYLQQKVQDLKAEIAQLKKIYELESFNHQQIRQFYKQRELEGVVIATEHRKMLKQYDQADGTSLSHLQQISLNIKINDLINHKSQMAASPKLNVQKSSCKPDRKIVKALSMQSSTSIQKKQIQSFKKRKK